MSSLAWIPQLPAGPGLSLSVFAVEGSCAQDELFLPSIPWKAGDRSPKLPVRGCDPTRLCGRDTGGHWGSVAPCQGVGCHQWSSPAPCAWFICQDLVSLPCWALPELVAALVTAGAVPVSWAVFPAALREAELTPGREGVQGWHREQRGGFVP